MDGNVTRRIALVVGLLAVTLVSALLVRPRLGLDLSGGTRVVLRVPFEEAVQNNMLDPRELNNKRAVIEQMIEIYRKRIDPTGVRDPLIRPESEDRIVIELPALATTTAEQAVGRLAAEIGASDRTLSIETDDEQTLRAFPIGGGTIDVEGELILYEQRDGNELRGLTRGAVDAAKPHAAQSQVRLKETDDLIQLLTSTGELHFYIEAKTSDFNRAGTDQATELQKVRDWMEANPGAQNLEAFNAMPPPAGPPRNPTIRWYTMVEQREAEVPFAERTPRAVVEQANPDWRFSGGDLVSEGVQPTQNRMGAPAVGFKIVDSKANAFGDFTEEHVNEPMAIVINGEVETMPTINSRLQGGGIIEGGGLVGFTEEEVKKLVTVLRSGSLRVRPTIESQERVGATLGEDSIRRGTISGALGLLATLIFMLFYYRRLGVIATCSMVANMVLLVGSLSFLKATLTLPGIAGIILTIGMAVDANILIYERIREEALRGRKPIQAAKDGFANALSTIVDSNLTTLITGIVLYSFGSGPVRGFATTLCIGILTSMFSALVITRLLVHLQLERGVDEWKMMRWVTDTRIPFIRHSRIAIPASAAAILLGLGVYFLTPDHDKFGIDFLGGVTMTVRTEQPQPVSEMRSRVRGIPGTIGETSEVKAILASGDSAEGFNEFRITFKADKAAAQQASDPEFLTELFRGEVREALGELLQRGPYEVEVAEGVATGRLYFQGPHPIDDIRQVLAEIPVEEVEVAKIEGPIAGYSFEGKVGPDKTALVLGPAIQSSFLGRLDSVQLPYEWAEPIPDYSTVGAAVVAELRDKAFFAILISLFFVVMYIRIRFAEYSYSLAAVVAVVHDVLIALGVLSLVIHLDNDFGITIVDAQINLPMIAAFLTIIGYSLNDTIVIFDRIRENLPRMKGSMTEIVDISINQTLSRTLLTSGTTLLTLLILLGFNIGSRNVLEGFSFTLSVGILAGTYSTVYIASPVLIYLEKRRLAGLQAGAEGAAKAKPKPAEALKS